jgi:dTDP-4-amino-4,6-dideoxygalactose transaminase
MKALEIQCVFHYVPLHSSPRGRLVGRASGAMTVTDDVAGRLVRLPLWPDLAEHQDRVIDAVFQFFRTRSSGR